MVIMPLPYEFDLELMFAAIEHRPCLWDKSVEGYKNRETTQAAWREVCRVLKSDFDYNSEEEKSVFAKEVVKKWNNVRDCHRRYMKQLKERGGSVGKKYLHSDNLQFLDKAYDDWQSAYVKEESNSSAGAFQHTSATMDNNCDDGGVGSDDIADPLSWESGNGGGGGVPSPSSPHIITSQPPLSRKRNRKIMLEGCLENRPSIRMHRDDSDNPHISFCKSYIPFLGQFSQDEIIDFQMGVLQLIRDIKNKQ